MRNIHNARVLCLSLLCGAGLAVALTACSTVKSVDISQTPIKDRRGAYFTYSVPKTLLTIQISAATSGSSASAGAGSAAAAGSTPTTWTLSGTISSGSGDSASSGSSKASPTDTSRCGVLTGEYAAAQTQVAARMADFTKLLAQTVRLAAPQPDAKPMESKDIQDYVTKTKAYTSAVNGAAYQDLMKANLPQAVSKSSTPGIYDLITAECPTKVNVTVQTSIIPDLSRNFALLHRTNPLYADSLTFGVDANNFLTNGAPSSTSQVGAIASAIASDIGLASAPSPGRLAGGVLNPNAYVELLPGLLGPERKKTAPSCRYDPAAELDAQLSALETCDPSKRNADAAAVTAIAEAIFVMLEKSYDPGSLQNLPSTGLPLTLYASLDDWAPDGSLLGATGHAANGEIDRTSAHRVLLSQALNAFRVSLDVRCAPRSEDEKLPDPASKVPMGDRADHPENATSAAVYDGLVVSATRPCRLEARQARLGFPGAPDGGLTDLPIAETAFSAQDSRYLTILPTQRGFLVARSVGYTFSGGLPTGVTDSRPSEALAVVSFPGQVVGAFFSGLSSAYSNRQTGVKGHTDEINAEANLYTAQAALVAAQQKANTAEHPAASLAN